MRLKILIVPFFIVMMLIIGIGFIKPDLDIMGEKKLEISTKSTQVANIGAVLDNISSLNSALDTQQSTEQFVFRYLPATLNQEQVIDSFNFIAAQSGLAITKLALTEPPKTVITESLADSSISLLTAGENSIVSAAPVVAKTFILQGSVTGQYENIKAFFDRISHIERFHNIHFFSIASVLNDAAAADGTTASSGNLEGVFEAEYAYLPAASVGSALSLPIFLQPKFDFSSVSSLLDQVTSSVPVLEKSVTGRPNPFQ